MARWRIDGSAWRSRAERETASSSPGEIRPRSMATKSASIHSCFLRREDNSSRRASAPTVFQRTSKASCRPGAFNRESVWMAATWIGAGGNRSSRSMTGAVALSAEAFSNRRSAFLTWSASASFSLMVCSARPISSWKRSAAGAARNVNHGLSASPELRCPSERPITTAR